MELTINIKTDSYMIKLPRGSRNSSSLSIPFPTEWIDKELLIIPILDDDLIRIKEIGKRYLISIFSLEMFHRSVKLQNKKRENGQGRVFIPLKYEGCEMLIIPMENLINDED